MKPEQSSLNRLTDELAILFERYGTTVRLAILFERYGTTVRLLRELVAAQDAIDECVTSDDCVSPPYREFGDALDRARAWLAAVSQ